MKQTRTINETSIAKALEVVDLSDERTITEAVDMLLGRNGIKVGDTVAIVDDPTYPFSGQKGVVTAVSEDTGYATVELPNKTKVPLLINQLVGVKA